MSSNPPDDLSTKPQPRRGGRVAVGLGIGFASYATSFFVLVSPSVYSGILPVSLVLLCTFGPIILGLVLAIIPQTRRIGLGVLIFSVAMWFVLLSACVTFFRDF